MSNSIDLEAPVPTFNKENTALSADRWASRAPRAAAFLRREGARGLVRSMRRAGAAGSWDFVRRNLRYMVAIRLTRLWDWRHHVDTSGHLELEHLSVVGPNKQFANPVVSTSPHMFRFLSRFFPEDRSRYTYVDLGAGKGRAVLLASDYGFRQCIGVEFVEVACAIASRNAETYRTSTPSRSSCLMLNADVMQYDLPCDNLVLYFANPFLTTLWPAMLLRIRESLMSKPRSIYLVLTGSQPENIWQGARLIRDTGLFAETARGTTPHFLDSYLPFAYVVFRTMCAPQ